MTDRATSTMHADYSLKEVLFWAYFTNIIRVFHFICGAVEFVEVINRRDVMYVCESYNSIWGCILFTALIHFIKVISHNSCKSGPDENKAFITIWATLHAIIGIWPMYSYFLTDQDCLAVFEDHYVDLLIVLMFECGLAIVSVMLVLIIFTYQYVVLMCKKYDDLDEYDSNGYDRRNNYGSLR